MLDGRSGERAIEEVAMLRAFAKLTGFVLLALAAVGVVFVAGMRAKSPLVLDAVRRTSRSTKPLVLKTAGTPGGPASVVRHTGRKTGQAYETPVGAVATDDGFVIALPYGSNTDWLKNVLAAGSATIVDNGSTYHVEQPEVVPMDAVQHHFTPMDQRLHRWFAVDQCLRVRTVSSDEAAQPAADPT
jgi:deazaflavin-dependent oxidoreductase (nitroreductase family)